MSDFGDLQDRVQALEDGVVESDDALANVQDELSSSIEEIQNQQSTDEETLGQLTFPLTQDTIDLITEQSPAIMSYLLQQNYIGTATLVAGTVTVTNPLVGPDSIILLSTLTTIGTPGFLSYLPSGSGSFIINSSSVTDLSKVIYFIIN